VPALFSAIVITLLDFRFEGTGWVELGGAPGLFNV